jgi:hypothetical protein
MSLHVLGAEPQDEEVPPMDDPFDLPDPPFDFFGLGQQANPAPFFDAPEPEVQQLEGGGWGQWIQGGANAAPAATTHVANAAHNQDRQGMMMDLNILAEDQVMHHLDLNVPFEEEPNVHANPQPVPVLDQLVL